MERDQGNGECPRGLGRVECRPDGCGVHGHRDVGRFLADPDAGGGVAEDHFAGLEDAEQGAQPGAGLQPGDPLGGKHGHHLSAGDLGEGLASLLGPGPQAGAHPPNLQVDGLVVAGSASGWAAGAVEHDGEPRLELRGHDRGQVGGLGAEVRAHGRDAVVVEQPGVGKDLQGRFDGRQAPLGQHQRDFAGHDLVARGGLPGLHGAQGRRDEVDESFAPAVRGGVLTEDQLAVLGHARMRRSRQRSERDQVGAQLEQRELSSPRRSETDRPRRRCGGCPHTTRRRAAVRGPSRRVVHVRQEQLLADAVGLGQVERFAGDAGVRGLLPAQPAGPVGSQGHLSSAVRALGDGMAGAPAAATPAAPVVLAPHSPGEAVLARAGCLADPGWHTSHNPWEKYRVDPQRRHAGGVTGPPGRHR